MMLAEAILLKLDAIHRQHKSTCHRKTVGAGIVGLVSHGRLLTLSQAVNGPVKGHDCTNEQGNCGCLHAEPQAVLRYVTEFGKSMMASRQHLFLLSSYSPCTNCANVIVASKIPLTAVVYGIFTHHDPRGADILHNAGIPLIAADALCSIAQKPLRWLEVIAHEQKLSVEEVNAKLEQWSSV